MRPPIIWKGTGTTVLMWRWFLSCQILKSNDDDSNGTLEAPGVTHMLHDPPWIPLRLYSGPQEDCGKMSPSPQGEPRSRLPAFSQLVISGQKPEEESFMSSADIITASTDIPTQSLTRLRCLWRLHGHLRWKTEKLMLLWKESAGEKSTGSCKYSPTTGPPSGLLYPIKSRGWECKAHF
jgi:hypothetical protein